MRLNTFHICICWLTVLLFAIPAAATPSLVANQTSVTLNWQPPIGSTPQPAQIELTSTEQITGLTVTKDSDWLEPSLGTTSTPATLGVGLNRAVLGSLALAGSPYTGHVTVTGSGGATTTITVTLNLGGSSSQFSASPNPISFSTATGALSQSIELTGATTTFTAVATSDYGWLKLSSTSGSIPGTLFAYADSYSGLTLGYTYTGYITITPATGSPITVNVSLGVGTTATTTVSPSQLTFNYQTGSAAPAAQSLTVSGPTGTSFTYSSGAAWLGVTSNSATLPATLTVTVDPTLIGASSSAYITIVTGTQTIPVLVSLNTSANPVLTASPAAVSVNYLIGSAVPAQTPIYVTASNGGALPFTAYANGGWLSLTSSSGTTPGTVAFTINPTGYTAGTYSGSITIYNTLYGTSLTVPVTLNVSGTGYGTQSFYTTPSALSFNFSGSTPSAQSVTVTSVTGLPMLFTATPTSSGWLSVTPTSAQTPASLTVSVNPTGLSAGSYDGTIAVTGYSTATGTQTIGVTLTVTQSGALTVSPASLSFNYQSGGSAPAAQTINVGSSTSQPLSYTTSASATWLSVTSTGTTPGTASVSVHPGSLSPGTYNANVTITSAGATNSPQTVPVTVVVAAPATVSATPTSLSFAYRTDGSTPGAQSVQVNSSGAALSYTASSSTGWLSVSPASGSTPANLSVSVNPGSLGRGTYNGTLTINATAPGGASSSQSVEVTLVVSGPLPTITSVKNAASLLADGVAPGEILLLSGSAMGPSDLTSATPEGGIYSSNALADTRVLFNGTPAPLLFVQASQVSAIVPFSMGDRETTFVQVEYKGVRSNAVTMPVVKSMAGLYTRDQSGTGQGQILNEDTSANSPQNPAAKGSVIMLFATGAGQVTPAIGDGVIANNPPYPQPILPVSVRIGGIPVPAADLTFIGTPPGQVAGMLQVSARIPLGVASGSVPVTLTVGTSSSQPGVVASVK